MIHRAGRWAHEKLLPGTIGALLLVDVAAGLNWMLSPDSSLASPVYEPAKTIMPMIGYGLVFLVLAMLAGALLYLRTRFVAGMVVGLILSGYWLAWATLFTIVPLGRGGVSYLSVIVSFGFFMLHALAGMALSWHDDTAEQS